MKFTYDKLADECLERLNEISPPNSRRRPGDAPTRDLYALLRDNASQDEKLGELWRQLNTIPDWGDWGPNPSRTRSVLSIWLTISEHCEWK